MKQLILASGSPRRRELLKMTGYDFTVRTAPVDEPAVIAAVPVTDEGADPYPGRVVSALSRAKAEAAAEEIEEGVIIGADTIVWNGEILGKPKDEKDAKRMLKSIAGNTHTVYTGVTVLDKEGEDLVRKTFYAGTDVTVYPMSEEEIDAYIATGEPMDKAGAYGIQGKFGLYVKEIKGDYNTVVGLPVAELYQVLKQIL